MEAVKSVNLALRFLPELCALVALGYWEAAVGPNLVTRLALAVGAPLAAATLWVLLVAPNAVLEAGPAAGWGVELLVFAAATAALVATGHRLLAVLVVVAYALNGALMASWDQ